MKNILITGTSSGIGQALSAVLVQRGHRVFGSVRRLEDAERLRAQFGPLFEPLIFDVTDQPALAQAAQKVAQVVGDQGLQVLVNNAGFATTGPLLHVPLEELRRQLDVNVTGTLAVVQAFAPLLGAVAQPKHPPGRLYQMGSVADALSGPFGGPYGASKRALRALTDALRIELMPFDIPVVLLQPGVVATDTREDLRPKAFAHTIYGPAMEKAQAFLQRQVQQGWTPEALAERMADLLEAPVEAWEVPLVRGRWLNWSIPRRLPQRLVAWAIGRHLGLEPTRNPT